MFRKEVLIAVILGWSCVNMNACTSYQATDNLAATGSGSGLMRTPVLIPQQEENTRPTDPADVASVGNDITIPPRPVDPSDVASIDTNPTSPTTPTPTCTAQVPSLNALQKAIQTVAPAGDQTTTIQGEAYGCAAGLQRFSAVAVNSSGGIVRSGQFMNAQVGVYCFANNGQGVDLMLKNFGASRLRGHMISSISICTYGTDPSTCNASNANFIAQFNYGPDSGVGRKLFGTGAIFGGSGTDAVASIVVAEKTYTDLNCATVALYSPLVIEKFSGFGVITLNPESTSTYFDLDGNGVKNRISCVTNGAYLTLPNQAGQIVNVNQLFGNNTVGPDNQKAANGFIALGKYDHKTIANGYGFITPADPVYYQLRLWEDTNCDGVAQASELHPLSDWNISKIKWIDSTPTEQVDPWGNHTEERSYSTLTNSDHVLRVFDIWFKSY